jgi:hypothetical protein
MKLRIMSSNIWGDYFGNPVEVREVLLENIFNNYSPDILAMQEATKNWNSSKLFANLHKKYEFIETPGVTDNNFLPLIYRRDLFDCIDSGFVKFEDTPDPSKGATWGVLSSKIDNVRLAVFCTHFWWKRIGDPEMDSIRVSNARKVSEKAISIISEYSVPAVILGDLNSRKGNPSMVYFSDAGWKFARDEAAETSEVSTHHGDPILGLDNKYHGKRTSDRYDKSIDHIIFRGDIRPERFYVVEDNDALDASDHSPIFCDFILP